MLVKVAWLCSTDDSASCAEVSLVVLELAGQGLVLAGQLGLGLPEQSHGLVGCPEVCSFIHSCYTCSEKSKEDPPALSGHRRGIIFSSEVVK